MLKTQIQIIRHAIEIDAKPANLRSSMVQSGIIQWEHYNQEDHESRQFCLNRTMRNGVMVHALEVKTLAYEKKGSALGRSRVISEKTVTIIIKDVRSIEGANIDIVTSDIYSCAEIKKIKMSVLHAVKEDLLKLQQQKFIQNVMLGKVA